MVNAESEFFVVSSLLDYERDSTSVLVEKYDTSGVRVWMRDLLMRETSQYGILAVAPQSDSLNLMVLTSNRGYNNANDSLVFVLFDNDVNIRGTWAVTFNTPAYQTNATISESDKVFVARRIDSDTVSYLQVKTFSSNQFMTSALHGTTPSSFNCTPTTPTRLTQQLRFPFDLPRRAEGHESV
ncbi:MAG: hypothetical protein IPP40_15790 [bacterium]|nr:hypothetical protein [bacterium]